MRICDHELKIRALLAKARVDSPGLCARVLTAYAAGLSRIDYILACDKELDSGRDAMLCELAARRAKGEPLAYILGEKEFYGLPFRVSSATLIPRPETEQLVEIILAQHSQKDAVFADLGCGSGCIGLTLLKLRPDWKGILIDSSQAALKTASANSISLGCAADFLLADIFNLPLAENSFNLVVSNPPYIAPAEMNQVMAETLAYEPYSALFSPPDGLAHIEAVIGGAARCLKAGGMLALEHGASQANAVHALLKSSGFTNLIAYHDLAGLPRCASAWKGKGNG